MSAEDMEAATELTQVLSAAEWLEAARLALGLGSGHELTLLQIKGMPSSEEGDLEGFVGETQRVLVRVRVRSGAQEEEEERSAPLFLKAAPRGNAARAALAAEARAFAKEGGFFQLVERLSARQPARLRLPPPWAPACLLVRDHAVVLEDLKHQGFRIPGLRATLDIGQCVAALEAVARLHGASLALEESDRRVRRLTPWRLAERFPDTLKEVEFSEDPSMTSKFFLVSLKAVKTIVSLMPKYKDSPKYQEILNKIDKLPTLAYELVKPSNKYRNVICHGDIWVNNIMFKYSSSGRVSEARLVDFQQVRYAPPALDVEAVLHLCLRRALREAEAPRLRDAYYDALCAALRAAGFDPRTLLHRKEFDETCRMGGAFARIAAASCLPGDLLPAATARALQASPDAFHAFATADRCAYVRDAFAADDAYRERVSEAVTELVDNLLLAKAKP